MSAVKLEPGDREVDLERFLEAGRLTQDLLGDVGADDPFHKAMMASARRALVGEAGLARWRVVGEAVLGELLLHAQEYQHRTKPQVLADLQMLLAPDARERVDEQAQPLIAATSEYLGEHLCGSAPPQIVESFHEKGEAARNKAELERLRAILDAPQTVLFADGRAPTQNERHLLNLLLWRQKEAMEAKAEVDRLQQQWLAACNESQEHLGQTVRLKREVARLRAGVDSVSARLEAMADAELEGDLPHGSQCRLLAGDLRAALAEAD